MIISVLLDARIVANVADFARFAHFPPKWQAGSSRVSAELTFYVGGCEGARRRNDTTSAECSRIATAPQGDYSRAIGTCRPLFAMIFSGDR